MSKLVVVGSVNADHVLRVPHFPRPGETLTGHSYRVVAGGKGANQAVAAARLGADIAFIARIGQDAIGAQMKAAYAADGVDIDGVTEDPELPTGIAIIYVADNGENSIGISPEANGHLLPDILQEQASLIAEADSLLLQLEVPLPTVEAAIAIAKQHAVHVVLNPAPARPLPDALLRQIDLITPNQTEAACLTGVAVQDEASAARAAGVLHSKGIPDVIITLGKQGVWFSRLGHGVLVPGFSVTAVDTTGAGDTFNGGLLAALQQQLDWTTALRFAQAAAALSVTRAGAQTSIPTRQDVEAFLDSQRRSD